MERQRITFGVGALLRSERLARGYMLKHLAARTAVSHETVRQIELGLRRPGTVALAALAAGLDPDGAKAMEARLVAAAGARSSPDQ